ncbi:hypothetical protein LK09_15145 [Microbacterium mangrovi]|uniref:Uncharacterized protein n=1 Tax=Microbacterium mangrovi TaxID=1348253 RepID=A0A0B2A437_9MICO|nr:hypothetical protein [Microbacterium mangrovi]KHK96333.1 hypothetical protein LK09_15145 [Microbacterium mangrovi]
MAGIGSTSRHATCASTAEPPEPNPPAYARVDIDRYVVLLDGPVGYVEVVPPVIVCYAGHPFPVAVEIAQVHDFDIAVRTVREHARRARRTPASDTLRATPRPENRT